MSKIDDLIQEYCDVRPIINAAELLNLSNDKYAYVRNIGFGASDSSKLLDINKFTKLDDLLLEKRNLVPLDPSINYKGSVRKGKDLEDFIMHKAQRHLNIEVHKPEIMYGLKDGSRLTVNFDGVSEYADLLVPIEFKICTCYGKKYYDWAQAVTEDKCDEHWNIQFSELIPHMKKGIDRCGIPNYYYTQLQQQMMFLNAPFGVLAVMNDDEWTMNYFVVCRDDDIIKQIQVAEVKHRWNLHSEEEILNKIKG